MKSILVLCLFLVLPSQLVAEIAMKDVLAMLNKQTIAANSGNIKALVATVPKRGVKVTVEGEDRPTVVTRAKMQEGLKAAYQSWVPGTYLFGIELLSAKKGANSIVLKLRAVQSYALAATGEFRKSSYEETATFVMEDGKVVISEIIKTPMKADKL